MRNGSAQKHALSTFTELLGQVGRWPACIRETAGTFLFREQTVLTEVCAASHSQSTEMC